METAAQATKRHCKIMRGDSLGSLMHSKPKLAEDVLSLWGTVAGVNVAPNNQYAIIFETEAQEHIIGLAKLVDVETGKGLAIGMIHDVIVDEQFRGEGLGKSLIAVLLRHGQDREFHHFELTCRPARQSANELYQKMGFTLVASAVGDNGTNLYRYIF